MNDTYEYKFVKPFSDVKCDKCNKEGFISDGIHAKRCDCWKAYKETILLFLKMLESNIIAEETSYVSAKILVDTKIDDYKGNERDKLEKFHKFVDKFDDKFSNVNLFFYGTNGTQKSTIAKAIIVELLRSGHTAYYIQTKELITLLLQAERDENKQSLVNSIMKRDLLVLDEYADDKVAFYSTDTMWKQQYLTDFLKTRLEIMNKSTIFISNQTIADMRSHKKFGDTLMSLLERTTVGCQFEFNDVYGDFVNWKELVKDIWG